MPTLTYDILYDLFYSMVLRFRIPNGNMRDHAGPYATMIVQTTGVITGEYLQNLS